MKDLYRFVFLSGIFIFFIAVKPAVAFEITPVKFLLTVEPGASQTIVVKIGAVTARDRHIFTSLAPDESKLSPAGSLVNIKNTPPSIPPLKGDGQGVRFKLSVLGMKQDEAGLPVFSRGSDAAESWVYPENNLVNIKSNETKSVNFIIKIPADAVAGSRYLGLAVEPVLSPVGGKEGEQASLTTRLVSLLTLQVKGMVEESVAIEKWAPLAGVTNQKKWKFDLSLKNNGTIEVFLRGTIAVRNWKGEEIFSEPIILGNKLLAGARRVLQFETILRNDINLPGLYSAQVKINYGLTNQTVSAISYIWYFPMWSKIVFLIFSIILLAVIVLIIKRRK